MAAPAETRTPNWHRARIALSKSVDGRVVTEAAWLNGKMEETTEKAEKLLTGTGLLMDGAVPLFMLNLSDNVPFSPR